MRRRPPSNIVKKRVFVQETVTVFEESKWTIYGWWLVQGTVAGAFGAITFSPQLTSPWWLVIAYLLAVFVLKTASVKLAQRLFDGDMWWQVTNIFLPSFLLAAVVAAVSRLTSSIMIALPVVVVLSFVIGLFHTTLRVVHVRELFTWMWRAAPLGTVAALAGWLLLYTKALTLSTAGSAAADGALVGFLYAFLTTALLSLMWDVSVSQSKSGTAYIDKHNEFEEALKLHAAAIAANPKDASLYVERALVHIRRGDLDQAQADAERALALGPKSREAQSVRAIIMSEKGEVDAAISEFHKLVDCKLGYQVGYLYRGRAYSRRGDYDCALYDYKHSLRLAEDAALTLVNRAETYYRMGDYDLAIADCDATLSAKTMICTVWTMALFVRGKCYAAKDEHELAASDFLAVLNSTADATLLKEAAEGLHRLPLPPPDDTDDADDDPVTGVFKLAREAEMNGDTKTAVRLYRETLRLDEEHPAANFALGRLLLSENNEEGNQLIERAMDIEVEFGYQFPGPIFSYLMLNGDPVGAALHQHRLRELRRIYSNAWAERSQMSFVDSFMSHDLPEREVEELRDEVAKHRRIREAYLVRKELQYMPEKPLYVMGLVFDRRWFRRSDKGQDFTKPGLYSFILDHRNRRVGKMVRNVSNSLIYRRAAD